MAKCKSCKKEYDKRNSQHLVCSYDCLIKYKKHLITKNNKRKYTKLEDKSRSDLIQVLQFEFNKFIRKRDALNDKVFKCINCGKIKDISKMDAGHYLAVSNYPSVRFNENNVHSQCSHCNRFSSSGHAFYKDNLIKKIGENEYNKLIFKSNKPLKLSCQEIIKKIKYYRKKNK